MLFQENKKLSIIMHARVENDLLTVDATKSIVFRGLVDVTRSHDAHSQSKNVECPVRFTAHAHSQRCERSDGLSIPSLKNLVATEIKPIRVNEMGSYLII